MVGSSVWVSLNVRDSRQGSHTRYLMFMRVLPPIVPLGFRMNIREKCAHGSHSVRKMQHSEIFQKHPIILNKECLLKLLFYQNLTDLYFNKPYLTQEKGNIKLQPHFTFDVGKGNNKLQKHLFISVSPKVRKLEKQKIKSKVRTKLIIKIRVEISEI